MTKEKVIQALLCELRNPEADLFVFNSGDFRIKIKDLKIYFNMKAELKASGGFLKIPYIKYIPANILVESEDYDEHFDLTQEEKQNILSVLSELKLTAESKVIQTLDEVINNCNERN